MRTLMFVGIREIEHFRVSVSIFGIDHLFSKS